MATRNSPSHKGTKPTTPAPRVDVLADLAGDRTNKTVTLDQKTVDRVDKIADELRTSFSGAAGLLISQALDAREATASSGGNILPFTELPPAQLAGIKEVSRLSGLDFKAVVVHILGTYLKETLARARTQADEMERALQGTDPE